MVVGGATISNALDDWVDERRMCQPKYGSYKLKKHCKTCKWKDSCKMADKERHDIVWRLFERKRNSKKGKNIGKILNK